MAKLERTFILDRVKTMAATMETNSKQGQGARNQILQTALELFSTKGYFNTSVQDIRRAADVSIGSIYHHFHNKEAIAKALYDEQVDELGHAIGSLLSDHPTTYAGCRAVVAHLFEMAETAPKAMQYILYAQHREFMPNEKPICSSRPFALLLKAVEKGMAAGEIRRLDPAVATANLFGGAIRLIQLKLDGVLQKDLAAYLDDTWQCAWRAVT
jgi:AcrR family transcriptional regulator